MPGSRDKLVSQAELDILVQQIIKRMASAGGGAPGASAFVDLTDVEADNYQDKALYAPRVNVGETALELIPLEDERIRFHHISDDSPTSGDGVDGDIWLEY